MLSPGASLPGTGPERSSPTAAAGVGKCVGFRCQDSALSQPGQAPPLSRSSSPCSPGAAPGHPRGKPAQGLTPAWAGGGRHTVPGVALSPQPGSSPCWVRVPLRPQTLEAGKWRFLRATAGGAGAGRAPSCPPFLAGACAPPRELGCGPSQVRPSRRAVHAPSQASDSRRRKLSVFQFSKIERIKQIRADVPTCNYQLISLDF